jgi:hypothetical protein
MQIGINTACVVTHLAGREIRRTVKYLLAPGDKPDREYVENDLIDLNAAYTELMGIDHSEFVRYWEERNTNHMRVGGI